eukprot:2610338-Alexandrium_andersonii.AAC.1
MPAVLRLPRALADPQSARTIPDPPGCHKRAGARRGGPAGAPARLHRGEPHAGLRLLRGGS